MYIFPNEGQKDLQEFLERLKRAKSRPRGERFKKFLSQEALNQIFDYLLLDKTSLKSVWKDKSRNSQLHTIFSLKPGEAYRLPKETTGLARTLNVLQDDSGEFQLIVETKSKLKNNEKYRAIKQGASKLGKSAWRIDSDAGEQEYFNLVFKRNIEDNNFIEQNAFQELAISKEMRSPEVNSHIIGQLFMKGNEQKISLYAIKAQGDLNDLLQNTECPLSEAQQQQLILEILKGTKQFHDKGYVHQDLKAANILFYGDPEEGYHIKLTDFGLSAEKGDKHAGAWSTASHQSPDIAYAYSDLKIDMHYYFHGPNGKKSLGYVVYREYKELFPLPPRSPADQEKFEWFKGPHPANDMWAIGITVFEMRYKRMPQFTEKDCKLIEADPLLKGLLDPDRQTRLTVDGALEVLHSQKEYQLLKDRQSPILFQSSQGRSENTRKRTSEKAPSSGEISLQRRKLT